MKHDHWDEKKIEQLLSNAPKIVDHRSKNEVYQRLKQEGVFDDKTPSKNKTIYYKTWVPYVISVAAILLCIISIPSFLKGMKENDQAATDSNVIKSEDSKSALENETLSEPSGGKTAFYENELEENVFFKIGLVSEAGDSVPITISIPKAQIQKDFGNNEPTTLQMYQKYASMIDEEKLGFIEFHPYAGNLLEDDDRLIHVLPSTQQYDISSSSYLTYQSTLKDTFSSYKEIKFQNENGELMNFKEIGEMQKPLQLQKEKYNYFRFTQSNGSQYLVPNFHESFNTVEEALNAMKKETNDIYQSVIIENVDYSIKVDGDMVVVRFKSEVNLDNVNQTEAMQMIEGILLTAANFDKRVKFENIAPVNWQGFNFAKPLPIPIGPNKISFSEIR